MSKSLANGQCGTMKRHTRRNIINNSNSNNNSKNGSKSRHAQRAQAISLRSLDSTLANRFDGKRAATFPTRSAIQSNRSILTTWLSYVLLAILLFMSAVVLATSAVKLGEANSPPVPLLLINHLFVVNTIISLANFSNSLL